MKEYDRLEKKIRRLEDRESIKQLVARYGFSVDDRDMESVKALFTKNGCFRSVNGQLEARGRAALVDIYQARFKGIQHSFHVAHDHVIEFESDTKASGVVASHAEVIRDDEPWVAAMRYQDIYVQEGGKWLFDERAVSFYYYVKLADYLQVMPALNRVRAMSEPLEADWPEKTATFRSYQAKP